MISTNWLIGLLSVIIWFLLFWNVLLRNRVMELRRELRRQVDYWNRREIEKTQERI